MVHRPADSRLLTNLLTHEKEYAKALTALFTGSAAARGALIAYASAAPPDAAHALSIVAAVFERSDAALLAYAGALEEWRGKLELLKELEDEVGDIMRDREILVTRLIKASKQQRPARDVTSPTGSTTSLKSLTLPSSGSTSKLGAAQGELQACEAHLAARERALQDLRTSAVVHGLRARCAALVECGWAWGEAGRVGVRTLEYVDRPLPNGSALHAPSSPSHEYKPLPDPEHAPSDISSSLSPSQSASQIALQAFPAPEPPSHDDDLERLRQRERGRSYSLSIPPAHAISEQLFPPSIRRRITEEDENGNDTASSDDDEASGALEVHENQPFGGSGRRGKGRGRALSLSLPARQNSTATVAAPARSDLGPRTPVRARRGSNLFGTLAGFFRSPLRSSASASSEVSAPDLPTTPKLSTARRWATRTDRNLRRADHSSDEDVARVASDSAVDYASLRRKSKLEARALPARPESATLGGSKLVKKTTHKRDAGGAQVVERGTASAADRLASGANGVTINGSSRKKRAGVEDGETLSRSGTMTSIRSSTAASRRVNSDPTKQPNSKQVAADASSPAAASVPLPTFNVTKRPISLDGATRSATGAARTSRSDTWSDSGTALASKHPSPRGHTHLQGHGHSMDTSRGQASLMSIVEGVTRQNREGWSRNQIESDRSPDTLLIETKAPRAITAADLNATAFSLVPEAPTYSTTRQSHTPLPEPRTLSSAESTTLLSTMHLTVPPPIHVPRTPSPLPLKSALRSRSPSPNLHIESPPPASSPQGTLTVPKFDDDGASISSYDTSNDVFVDANEEVPPTPPPHDADTDPLQTFHLGGAEPHHAGRNGVQPASDLSASSGSASTATAPARRKSVRMSLQPTFSPTPPALEDEEDDHAPWSTPGAVQEEKAGTWRSHERDVTWEDSSEEDEEYSLARRLLSRAAKKLEKAGHRTDH